MIAQAAAGWHDFYLMVGTASATMVGLLFVALSLERMSGVVRGPQLRIMAAQAFLNFTSVVLFAVIFLIPNQDRLGLGLPLVFIGVSAFASTLRRIIESRKTPVDAHDFVATPRLLIGSAVCYLALIAVAVSVLLGYVNGLYWLVPVMALLIIEASRNAWRLVLERRTET